MRICDWSSDVFSSDLVDDAGTDQLGNRILEASCVVEPNAVLILTRRPVLRFVDPRLINGPGFRALRRERHVHEQYDIAALGENLGGILPLIFAERGNVDRKSTRLNSSH